MTTAFVLTIGDRPYATATDLDTAQTAGLTDETRYQTEPREYEWQQSTVWQTGNGRVWNLMVRSTHTKRWNKTLRSVAEVRTLPPVPSTPEA
jgi:hypothetical protein